MNKKERENIERLVLQSAKLEQMGNTLAQRKSYIDGMWDVLATIDVDLADSVYDKLTSLLIS